MAHSLRQVYYDGELQKSHGRVFQTVDPSTGKPLADIGSATQADVDAAICSASKAFQTWSTTPPITRSRILLRTQKLLRERNDDIAKVETADTGKPFSETGSVDVVSGADVVEYFAGLIAGGGLGGEITQLRKDAWIQSTKEPLGVCAGIGAWNYPIQIALWKSAPCLAAGNTMVYKPSEVTPLHAEILAKIYTEAGLPPGVFNVVYGAGDIGQYLASHSGIAKVSFTGQVSTGKEVAGTVARQMKYVTMELGGKNPLIVLPDVDLEAAVDGAMMANFYSSGQICTNGTRVFVPEAIKHAFEERLLDRMQYVRLGDLHDPATNFGPLVSKFHYDKVTAYIDHGITTDQARLLYGGLEKPKGLPDELVDGYWIQPTIFTDCTDSMKIVQHEIFGPVLSILTYKDVEEAVERANNTELGLAAGVFGKDLRLAHKVVSKLQAGITWINTWGESPAEMSVGGWKQSGLGVENGRRGIEAWVQNKSTLVEMSGVVPTAFSKPE